MLLHPSPWGYDRRFATREIQVGPLGVEELIGIVSHVRSWTNFNNPPGQFSTLLSFTRRVALCWRWPLHLQSVYLRCKFTHLNTLHHCRQLNENMPAINNNDAPIVLSAWSAWFLLLSEPGVSSLVYRPLEVISSRCLNRQNNWLPSSPSFTLPSIPEVLSPLS